MNHPFFYYEPKNYPKRSCSQSTWSYGNNPYKASREIVNESERAEIEITQTNLPSFSSMKINNLPSAVSTIDMLLKHKKVWEAI
jgi:hypothetical protein